MFRAVFWDEDCHLQTRHRDNMKSKSFVTPTRVVETDLQYRQVGEVAASQRRSFFLYFYLTVLLEKVNF
jgi:hypothetical protein